MAMGALSLICPDLISFNPGPGRGFFFARVFAPALVGVFFRPRFRPGLGRGFFFSPFGFAIIGVGGFLLGNP